jgi:hypothetical protein
MVGNDRDRDERSPMSWHYISAARTAFLAALLAPPTHPERFVRHRFPESSRRAYGRRRQDVGLQQ